MLSFEALQGLFHEGRITPAAVLRELRALLGTTPDVGKRDTCCGYTMLHDAARLSRTYREGKRCMELICLLHRAGANVDEPARNGETPLHHAAKAGSWKAAHCLLALGANPNATDIYNQTPLDLASCDKTVSVLTAAGGRRRKHSRVTGIRKLSPAGLSSIPERNLLTGLQLYSRLGGRTSRFGLRLLLIPLVEPWRIHLDFQDIRALELEVEGVPATGLREDLQILDVHSHQLEDVSWRICGEHLRFECNAVKLLSVRKQEHNKPDPGDA